MIHRYEIDFYVMYDGKVTDLQSAIISAYSLEEANQKLQSEVKRGLGKCRVKIDHTSVLVSEESLANSKAFSFGRRFLNVNLDVVW